LADIMNGPNWISSQESILYQLSIFISL